MGPLVLWVLPLFAQLSLQPLREIDLDTSTPGRFGQKPKDAGKSRRTSGAELEYRGMCVLTGVPLGQAGVEPPALS